MPRWPNRGCRSETSHQSWPIRGEPTGRSERASHQRETLALAPDTRIKTDKSIANGNDEQHALLPVPLPVPLPAPLPTFSLNPRSKTSQIPHRRHFDLATGPHRQIHTCREPFKKEKKHGILRECGKPNSLDQNN